MLFRSDETEKLDLPAIDEKSILEEVENQLLNTLNQLKNGLNVNDERINLLEGVVNKNSSDAGERLADISEQLEKLNAGIATIKAQQKSDKEAAVNSDAVAACVDQLRNEMNVKFSQTVATLNATISALTSQVTDQKSKIDELEGKLASVKNANQQALAEYVKHDDLTHLASHEDLADRKSVV